MEVNSVDLHHGYKCIFLETHHFVAMTAADFKQATNNAKLKRT